MNLNNAKLGQFLKKETMRQLTEGRDAETLEQWLDELSAW